MPHKYTLHHLTYSPTEGSLYAPTQLTLGIEPQTTFNGQIRIVYTVDSAHLAQDVTLFVTPIIKFTEKQPFLQTFDIDFVQLKDQFDEHVLYNVATVSVIICDENGEELNKYTSVINVLKRDYGTDPKRSIFSPF